MDHYSRIRTVLPPYEHQQRCMNEAVDRCLSDGYHALFMDMGTGKTKTTLDTLAALIEYGRADALMVVCPKSIVGVWQDEVPKHFASPASIHAWNGKTTRKTNEDFEMVLRAPVAIMLVNVESFQTLPETMHYRVKQFLTTRRALMVVDESSYVKSSDARRTKAVISAGKLAKNRLILTGTEITTSILDLYSQFEFLKPGFWGIKSFYQFKLRYAVLQDSYGAGGRTFKKVVGFQRVNELMDHVSMHISRAKIEDCLDLPEKIKIIMHVDLSEPQAKAYKNLKDSLVAMINGNLLTVQNKISLFAKFRQITGGAVNVDGNVEVLDPHPPKLQALIDDVSTNEEQVIVWAAFTHEIKMISEALSKIGTCVTFFGETKADERLENVHAFQDGTVRFFIANPRAGGFGLNLQNCHIQYFYSRDLQPAANWQAEARSHRNGQKHPCVYKTLVARGTVDERVEDLLNKNTDLRMAVRDMTIQDIVSII